MGFLGLSSVVAITATVPAVLAWTCHQSLPFALNALLWHISSVGFAVAVASLPSLDKKTTGFLGKRNDGTIDLARLILFAPYHLGLRAKLAIQRKLGNEPTWNAVAMDLFIGGWPNEASSSPPVSGLAVLDVTCELPLQLEPSAYLAVPVWDTRAPSPEQIEMGVRWALHQQMNKGHRVLIHCAHGHGRSGCMMAALLIAKGLAGTVLEAEAIMKKARPRVRLNARQRRAVETWVLAFHRKE
jgi:hypothetical protein